MGSISRFPNEPSNSVRTLRGLLARKRQRQEFGEILSPDHPVVSALGFPVGVFDLLVL